MFRQYRPISIPKTEIPSPPLHTEVPGKAEVPGDTYGPNTAAELIRRIQHAGRHKVQLEVVYNRIHRNIEPYSFRRKKTGLLLFAYCHLHEQIESFRLDRFQNMIVTELPYKTELYPIEL